MLRRGGQRDALEPRQFLPIVKKERHLLAYVYDEAAEHRFDLRRKRVEFFEREVEGDFLFGARGTFHNRRSTKSDHTRLEHGSNGRRRVNTDNLWKSVAIRSIRAPI